MDYEEKLKSLSDSQKLELWSKWEKSNLSKESRIRAVYYEARSLKYL